MDRRSFTKCAVMAVSAIGVAIVLPEKKYGRVSVKDHPALAMRCNASLNGRNVSSDCVEADDVNGYVRVIRKSGGKGTYDYDREEFETERLKGFVRIWEVR